MSSQEETADIRKVDGTCMDQSLLVMPVKKHRDLAIAELTLGNAFQQCRSA